MYADFSHAEATITTEGRRWLIWLGRWTGVFRWTRELRWLEVKLLLASDKQQSAPVWYGLRIAPTVPMHGRRTRATKMELFFLLRIFICAITALHVFVTSCLQILVTRSVEYMEFKCRTQKTYRRWGFAMTKGSPHCRRRTEAHYNDCGGQLSALGTVSILNIKWIGNNAFPWEVRRMRRFHYSCQHHQCIMQCIPVTDSEDGSSFCNPLHRSISPTLFRRLTSQSHLIL